MIRAAWRKRAAHTNTLRAVLDIRVRSILQLAFYVSSVRVKPQAGGAEVRLLGDAITAAVYSQVEGRIAGCLRHNDK